MAIHASKRYPEVDWFRGVAVLLMIAFHIVFDLKSFGVSSVSKHFRSLSPLFWTVFPHTSSVPFLALVGCSAFLKSKRIESNREFLPRAGWVLLCALGISVASFLATPQAPIYFGILHCIGFSILLLIPFLNFFKFNGVFGITLVALGPVARSFHPANLLLLPFGFMPEGFTMGDYYPLIPYFGVVLVGHFFARAFYEKWRFDLAEHPRLLTIVNGTGMGRSLQAVGRQSLPIYLVHQPLLLAAFYLLGCIRF